jgi:hypothetical protein
VAWWKNLFDSTFWGVKCWAWGNFAVYGVEPGYLLEPLIREQGLLQTCFFGKFATAGPTNALHLFTFETHELTGSAQQSCICLKHDAFFEACRRHRCASTSVNLAVGICRYVKKWVPYL